MDQNPHHISVMLEESVASLALSKGDTVIDCTVGAGGHTEKLLTLVGREGLVIGIDRDASALEIASKRLSSAVENGNLKLFQAPFSEIYQIIEPLGLKGKIQGILADIGVSSMHLNEAARGFSFQLSAPLDMRMNPSTGISAKDFINTASQEELANIFWKYGEEPQSRKIAQRIVEERNKSEIITTDELAEIVKRSVRYTERSKKHPATKIFQALRIYINDELNELQSLLTESFSLLKPRGILAIISFHSLEDRIVKTQFISWTGRKKGQSLPRNLPLTQQEIDKIISSQAEIIKPFPMIPSSQEIDRNPRSRSARLRVIRKNAE